MQWTGGEVSGDAANANTRSDSRFCQRTKDDVQTGDYPAMRAAAGICVRRTHLL